MTLSAVVLISALSVPHAFTNANAALTAPSNYDYAYTYGPSGYQFNNNVNGKNYIGIYQQTSSFGYFNYDINLAGLDGQIGTSDDEIATNTTNKENFGWPYGLNVIMRFKRSNTTWTNASPTFPGFYPTSSNIGSSSVVGTTDEKVYININNQTNKNYYFYSDNSSINSYNVYWYVKLNNQFISDGSSSNRYAYYYTSNYFKIIIPAYTNFEFYTEPSSASRYLDAWYLEDLGVSEAYTNGVDYGQNNPPFSELISTTLSGMATIMNIQILGAGITLGTIMLFPLLAVVFFVFKKVIQ